MSRVFLDTVGLIALWDTDDQWHTAADAAYQRMVADRKSSVATTFVLLECGNTAARRTFQGDVCSLRKALELRNELVVPTNDDWLQAWAAYERREAALAGIVDHVSFVVMRRLGIVEAFTNDLHFAAAGFAALFQPATFYRDRRQFLGIGSLPIVAAINYAIYRRAFQSAWRRQQAQVAGAPRPNDVPISG